MWRSLAIGLVGVLAVSSACSSDDGGDTSAATGSTGGGLVFAAGAGGGATAGTGAGAGTSGTGAGNGGFGGSAPSAGAAASSGTNGAAGSCPVTVNDAGCTGQIYVGETIPLDIYILFDQSGSMLNNEQGGVTRMEAVRQAVDAFVRDPKSAGLGVGIGYFGYEPIGQTTCAPADYEKEAVAIGRLPDNAQAIVDSLAAAQPTGETPSGPAIRGACSYARAWQADHPTHATVILLVTDGKPEAPVTCPKTGACCPTLEDAVAAATECQAGMFGAKTYVLGVGPLLDNLGQIAVAGGTSGAYLVAGGDVSAQVLARLNEIRAAATIPCQLEIPTPPAGETVDLNRVNVVHTTNACETRVIAYRDNPASCDGAIGGWYFDDPASPQKVVLCGKTCDDVSIPGGQLLFSVGCGRYSIH
jgi:Mg-chelatase subunit ChlD